MKLNDWLKQSGIRPSRFAKKIGVSPGTLSLFIRGKAGITLETAKKISEGSFGAVTLDDLANGISKEVITP